MPSLDWWAATKAPFESGALQIGKQASAIARGLISTSQRPFIGIKPE
jgi:hypothetical protein